MKIKVFNHILNETKTYNNFEEFKEWFNWIDDCFTIQ